MDKLEKKALKEATGGNIKGNIKTLLQLSQQCISVLETAQNYYKNQITLDSSSALENMANTQLTKKPVNRSLQQASSNISKSDLRKKTKQALMAGYTLVNRMRAFSTGEEIQYEIVVAGKKLASAHLSMDELLESATLDFSKNGIALRVARSSKILENLINSIDNDNVDLSKKYNQPMMQNMRYIKMSEQDSHIWQQLVSIKEGLDAEKLKMDIKGIEASGFTLNYGNLIEAFMEYYYNKEEYQFDEEHGLSSYYKLLEKSRNDLAYYYGPDIENQNLQIKGLSTQGSTGRFDIATLSNVLTPLKQIRDLLAHLSSDEQRATVLKEKLKNKFTVGPGAGDRPFKDDIKNIVKNIISEKTGLPIT